jgi:hypothetical protein
LGDEDDDRHEQDDTDLEEQREPEDRRDRRHDPGQAAGAHPADHGRDDAVGPAGVLEELADHRAEGDEDADRPRGRAEPRDEAGDGVSRRHGGDRPEDGRAQHEGQEGVDLGPRDEHDDGEDAEDAREHELRVPGVHRRRFVGEGERGRGGRRPRGWQGEK